MEEEKQQQPQQPQPGLSNEKAIQTDNLEAIKTTEQDEVQCLEPCSIEIKTEDKDFAFANHLG